MNGTELTNKRRYETPHHNHVDSKVPEVFVAECWQQHRWTVSCGMTISHNQRITTKCRAVYWHEWWELSAALALNCHIPIHLSILHTCPYTSLARAANGSEISWPILKSGPFSLAKIQLGKANMCWKTTWYLECTGKECVRVRKRGLSWFLCYTDWAPCSHEHCHDIPDNFPSISPKQSFQMQLSK